VNLKANIIPWLVAVLSLQGLAGSAAHAAEATPVNEIHALLDDFNRAATNADLEGYFACLAPDGVFLGTDATERWTVDELRAFVKPYFDQGVSRAHTPRERHVDLCPGGNVAFFDELVELESLGECRGTGVVIKHDDKWLIAQYSLSFPVPNEIVFDVVDLIGAYHDKRDGPAADDRAGIRESLAAYLATASFPEPEPIDPELFTTGIEALWSNGETYQGRESVVEALEQTQREVEEAFESFEARAEQVHVRRRGDVAWVTCRITMKGTLTEGGGQFTRTVRSSFVFEKQDDRWRVAQEHSSRLADADRPAPRR
jgi:ketosteroid isomerase-like protein